MGGVAPALGPTDGEHEKNSSHLPTDAQLEAAVQPISGGVQSEPLRNSSPTEDLEDDNERQLSAPLTLNAFDLVSQCGGFMLDRMFSPEIFYTAPVAEEGVSKKLAVDTQEAAKNVGGSILFGSTYVKTKCYHFTASNISVEDLTLAVFAALEAMSFDFETSKQSAQRNGVLKASLLSAKGMLGMFIQVFSLTPSLTLLEIKKGKGDILEWNAAYSELVDKRIAHLINKPKLE